jgi:REP element-mobilizing transposase RayT
MPRSRRDRRQAKSRVVHLTNRAVIGLPFLRCELLNALIWSALAHGQKIAPVRIAGVQFMGNHFHLVLFSKACLVSKFMNIFEGELAKAIKRLYGAHYPGKVWRGRFKEQRLATPDDVLEKLCYLYLNPVRANLVDKVDEWEGVSTWRMFINRAKSRQCRLIPSRMIQEITHKPSSAEYQEMTKGADGKNMLRIEPFGWLGCFSECAEDSNWQEERVRLRMLDEIKRVEGEYRVERQKRGKRVRSAKQESWIAPNYRPKSKGRTPFLICHDKKLRYRLIMSYRRFCEVAHRAYLEIKYGKPMWRVRFPVGALKPPLGVWTP